MPRKYTRKTPLPGGNDAALAAGLAAAAAVVRPWIQQIVRETIVEMFGDWMSKNAPKTVGPEDISRLGPSGTKREG